MTYSIDMIFDKEEYDKRIADVQKLCLSYGLKPAFGNYGQTKTEIDYRYDSNYIKSCGEIVRLWPNFESGNCYIVLFNKLYSEGSCYYWNSDFISEPLKNKIKKYHPVINHILDLKYLYVYGMDLIKETIEFAIKDMKKFDMNIKLKRIEKDF